MRINRKQIIIFFAVMFFLMNCGSSAPPISDARAVFEKRYEREIKDGTMKVNDFKKVDGQSGEFMGVKLYSLKYEAEVVYPKGLTCNYVSNLCGWTGRTKGAGEKEILKGEVNFEKTENGWQVHK